MGAFDDLVAIRKVIGGDLWLHVDGAYISPQEPFLTLNSMFIAMMT